MSFLRGITDLFSGRVRQAVKEFTGEADEERQLRERERERRQEEQREREEQQRNRGRGAPPIAKPPGEPLRREPLPEPSAPWGGHKGAVHTPRYEGPRTDGERERLANSVLPILTTSPDHALKHIRANELTGRERKSLVDYWINVHRYQEGRQADIGEWTGGAFQIGGHWIETSLDNIDYYSGRFDLPLPREDLYEEI